MRQLPPQFAALRRGILVALLGVGGGLMLWGGSHSAYLKAKDQAQASQAQVEQQGQARQRGIQAQKQNQLLAQRLSQAQGKGWITVSRPGEDRPLAPHLAPARYPGLTLRPAEPRFLAQEARWRLVSQSIQIHLPLRHEAQLLDLLEQLQSPGQGLLRVQNCQVAWAEPPEEGGLTGEPPQPGALAADCRVERLTLQAPPPGETSP